MNIDKYIIQKSEQINDDFLKATSITKEDKRALRRKFTFGKNWKKYLDKLDDSKTENAKTYLRDFIYPEHISHKTFLDIGCGSGLFSLSAHLLGADRVISFDLDYDCVNCAKYLREKYNINWNLWEIENGSITDNAFVEYLGQYDIVYSWGVLHHTGSMWHSLANACKLVKPNGLLYIAIYNKCSASERWVKIKRFYNETNWLFKKLMEWGYISAYIGGLMMSLRNPFKYIKDYSKGSGRGMSFYRDCIDWLGGWPYEFATNEEIIGFYKEKGFELIKMKAVQGLGCNEFLFRKSETF